jgi:hypothetical protein
MDRYRQSLNRALEDEVGELLAEAGYKYRVRVNPNKPATIGLSTLSGEIDAVAVRSGGKHLWVIEAKDPASVHSVAEIKRAIDRFHGPGDGWVTKLTKKVEDVQQDPKAVCTTLGVTAWEGDVQGLMVTRRPVPAAFVEEPRVPFVTLDELRHHLFENDE